MSPKKTDVKCIDVVLVFGYERIVPKAHGNQTNNCFAWLRLRASQATAAFPRPANIADRGGAQSGANWLICVQGASRCCETGRVEFAPFHFRGSVVRKKGKP